MSASFQTGDSPEQKQLMSAMFASLVVQNTNMALIFLGHAPNPQTGQTVTDLENAKYFIDQLEMLAVKTKGNLERNEETMLKQSLTTLRLAFVEAVSKPPVASAPPATDKLENPPTDEQETPSSQEPAEGEPAGEPAPIVPPSEAESKKKFTKKY
jgi:hypothetical protein